MRTVKLWSPVLILIAAVRFFSSQPAGSPVLEGFPLPFQLGHFIGYGLLGFFLYRALAGGVRKWHLPAALGTIFFTLIYAIFDEYLQGYVPGRTPSVNDVFIDMGGVLTALLLCRGLGYLAESRDDTAKVLKSRASSLKIAPVKAEVLEEAMPGQGFFPGAILLYCAVVAGVLYVFPFSQKFFVFLMAATLVMITGLPDRIIKTHYWLPLMGQSAAALMLVFGNSATLEGLTAYFFRWHLPHSVVLLLAAAWVIMVTNSFGVSRELDGADLAAVGAFAGLFFGLSQLDIRYLPPAAVLLLLVAASGIFFYNRRVGPSTLGPAGGALFGFSLAAFLLFTPGTPYFFFGFFCSLFVFVFPFLEMISVLAGKILKIPGEHQKGGDDVLKDRLFMRLLRLLYLAGALAGATLLTSYGLPNLYYIAVLLVFMALPGAVNILRIIGTSRARMVL